MAERDSTQREILFSDVPGDREKVRAILAQWGVEDVSIRHLLREHNPDPHGGGVPARAEGAAPPPSHAGH